MADVEVFDPDPLVVLKAAEEYADHILRAVLQTVQDSTSVYEVGAPLLVFRDRKMVQLLLQVREPLRFCALLIKDPRTRL